MQIVLEQATRPLKISAIYELGNHVDEFKTDRFWLSYYATLSLVRPKGNRFRHKYEGRLKMEARKKKTERVARKLANVEMACYDCSTPLYRVPWQKRTPRMYVWTTPKVGPEVCSVGRFYEKRRKLLLEILKAVQISISYRYDDTVPVCLHCMLHRTEPDHAIHETRAPKRERLRIRRSLCFHKAYEIFRGVSMFDDDDFY